MKQRIAFVVTEKCDGTPIVYDPVLVECPENWHEMTKEEQREYLIKPVSEHRHPGQILYTAFRFQLATGVEDEIYDFNFETVA